MEPTKQGAANAVSSPEYEKTPFWKFPDLSSPGLSQGLEDQASLVRIKNVWENHASGWSPGVQRRFLGYLLYVRTDITNQKTPSKHKLYNHIDFSSWVVLKCMYPENQLDSFEVSLMEKYPGIDLSGFAGPDAINVPPKENKTHQTKATTPGFENKMLEDDDKFNVSDFSSSATGEDCTLVNLPPAPDTLPQLRGRESKFRSMVLGGPSRGSYNEFLKSKPNQAADKDDQLGVLEQIWTSPGVVRGSDVQSLSSGSDTEDVSAQATLSDKQFQELKDLISDATAETRQSLSKEIHKMHAATTKQVQNMHAELTEKLMKNQNMLIDVTKKLVQVQTTGTFARIDQAKLDRVEARAVNIEEFIKSL